MENGGWEIRPAGWVVLLILAALLAYLIIQRLQDSSGKAPK
jgi:hypothetical protein